MFVRNEPSPENTAQYQEMVDAIWDSWASSIAESRGISPEKFNSAIDNLELNFPQDYVDAGMVDELLTLDQLKEKLTEYFQATSFEKASMISLSDYATLTAVPNFRAGNTVAVIFANGNILDGDAEQQVTGDRFGCLVSMPQRKRKKRLKGSETDIIGKITGYVILRMQGNAGGNVYLCFLWTS